MSRLQHSSESAILPSKTIALAIGFVFIVAVGASVPKYTSSSASVPLATPTATNTPTPTTLPTPFPEYDLTISQSDTPDPVISGHPVTYTLTVTNSPSALGGFACPNVRFGYPSGVSVTFNSAGGTNGYSATADSGGVTFTGGCLSSQGGVAATATLAIIIIPEFGGTLTSLGSSVVVDPGNNWPEDNENNNTAATIQTTVTQATPTITATSTPTDTPTNTATSTSTATATLTASPTPSGIFIQFSSPTYYEDESQTAAITVTRTGNISETNTVSFNTMDGTAIGGSACSGFSSAVDYVTQPFQPVVFNPNETSKTVNVTLCGDGRAGENDDTINLYLTGDNLGIPAAAVLTINDTATANENQANIAINSGGAADLYPSTILVHSAPFLPGSMRVTVYDYSTAVPTNVSFLLVGPDGQKFILMANAGGLSPSGPATLTFADTAGQIVPLNGPLTTGDFEPTSYGIVANFPAPAPSGPYNLPGSTIGGFGSQMMGGNPNSTFGGINPNGTVWSLYVREQAPPPFAPSTVVGNIAGGWGIEFFETTAAGAFISGRVLTADGRGIRNAKVTVTGNSLVAPIIATTGSLGYFSFEGLATGETYILTVNSKRYTFNPPSRVISLQDNVIDADFAAY